MIITKLNEKNFYGIDNKSDNTREKNYKRYYDVPAYYQKVEVECDHVV